MISVNKLKGKMTEKGISVRTLAEIMGIDPTTFYRKMNSGGENFTIGEVNQIVSALSLSSDEAMIIFFAETVA